MIVSLVALFVALGGTGYAVSALPRNSVGPAQLRKSAVTGPKLASGAVTGAKVRNGSIAAADLSSAARSALTGAAGPQGTTGPQGTAGPQGAAGPSYSFSVVQPTRSIIPTGSVNVQMSQQTISLPRAGRLALTFSGSLEQSNGASAARTTATCELALDTAPEQTSTIGTETVAGDPSDGSTWASIDETMTFDLPAGQRVVSIRCSKSVGLGAPTLALDGYTLTAVLTGT